MTDEMKVSKLIAYFEKRLARSLKLVEIERIKSMVKGKRRGADPD